MNRAQTKRITRRRVLAGAVTASGLAGPVLQRATAEAGGSAPRRPWWVSTVDRPTLAETNSEFGRFAGPNIFAMYARLKDERDGEGAVQAERQARRSRIADSIRQRKPGYDLRDRQIAEAAWTLMRSTAPGEGILSWVRLRVPPPSELGAPAYSAGPEEAARTVKTAARLFGAALAGIAAMNEKYVNRREGAREIVFEDVAAPAATAARLVIPRKMKWVVAIAVAMDQELMARCPTALGDAATSLGYSQCAFTVATLAEFIRGLGYQAIPSVNDTAQSVPFAVDAGLGELSRLNRLVTPEYGAAVRLCKVFTDLPMACDEPIDFGAASYCKRCKMCAEACPAGALSFDDEPSYKVRGPWNNPGHKTWFEDAYKCYQQWQQVTTACSICFAVCPYTRCARAWAQDAARSVPQPGPPRVYPYVDVALNWEKQRDSGDWWEREG